MTTTERTKPKPVTAGELLEMHSRGVKGELIRGVYCETMSAGTEHGEITALLMTGMVGFVRPRRIGRVFGGESGVLLEKGPDTVREPDVAYVSAEKLPLGVRVTGYLEVIPDLVAEIISPNDRSPGINDKTRMWLSYGVRMVWEVYPERREVWVHQLGQPRLVLGEDDTLDGGDILPGFSIPVRDIFDV